VCAKRLSRFHDHRATPERKALSGSIESDLNNSIDGAFVITAITAMARHPGRFDVDVNGKTFALLSVDALERLRISIGTDVTDRCEAILAEAGRLAVYDRALNMLAFRARSSTELSRALIRKGADPEQVKPVIERLVEQGFLDDAAFARAFTRAKVVGASHSRRRVEQELRRKGVARDIASDAIGKVLEDEGVDQLALVEKAARRKLRTLAELEAPVRRRRLYAFLARRGFDAGDIHRVMSALEEPIDSIDGE
jgi:Uncharacterized protein conserved in bacteria